MASKERKLLRVEKEREYRFKENSLLQYITLICTQKLALMK
jgi:hypothetical protein